MRGQICAAGRALSRLGLVGAKEGNLSVRLDDGRVLVTPHATAKGALEPDGLVTVSLSGQVQDGGRPTSELALHLEAYRQRPDCHAVVHAHPPVATAFTLVGETLPDDVLPESGHVLGPVALVPYAEPASEESAHVASFWLKTHKTLLLSHHGALTLGATLDDAMDRMETLERVARVLWHARALGQIQPLPGPAFETLKAKALHGRLD